jgi:CRP-like cAMP-binding protein
MATAGAGIPLRSFRSGEIIFRQGETASTEAYFVHRGRVEVRRTIGGDERVLCTLGIGELLGEVALFRQGPHSATAVALEEVHVLVIPADRLEHVVRTNPQLAIAIIRQLARMAAGDSGSD